MTEEQNTQKGVIFAIDPGNVESGYAVVTHNGVEITCVLHKGKIQNEKMLPLIERSPVSWHIAIEMVASYGMAVGAEVFDTCVWIGRFQQAAQGRRIERIYRKEEKLYLCGKLTAKDTNISQALVDRFAPGSPNKGKGTAKAPGFFYGFSKDMWAAMAVATTYFDKYIRRIQL